MSARDNDVRLLLSALPNIAAMVASVSIGTCPSHGRISDIPRRTDDVRRRMDDVRRGDGWADVWKRHHLAWEYKGKRADLDAAFDQLRQYSLALENPPLLIVSDMVRFRIRTNWTNSVSRTH